MPTISSFYGLIIQMFYDDHAPPHFHAKYAEFEATIDLRDMVIVTGSLPRRAQSLVLDWAELHREELLANWVLCRDGKEPARIDPLR